MPRGGPRPGSGRSRIGDGPTHKLSVRIPATDHRALRLWARARGCTLSQAVRLLIAGKKVGNGNADAE